MMQSAPKTPWLELALDTSGNALVLDLWKLGEANPLFRYESTIQHQRTHSALLVPLLKDALEAQSANASDLATVYFCPGPGSFTGLRASLSVVRTLGQFIPHLNIYPVDSLTRRLFQAIPHLPQGASCVTVALDARRKRLYTATFCYNGSQWCTESAPRLVEDELLKEQLERRPNPVLIYETSLLDRLSPKRETAQFVDEALFSGSEGQALRNATQHLPLNPQPWHTLDALYLQAPNVIVPTHLNMPTFQEMERMTHE
jgi:tRNA threonylcarbamoyl adenosine modification protein YeaZ